MPDRAVRTDAPPAPSWPSLEAQLAAISANSRPDLVYIAPRQAAVLLDMIRHGALRRTLCVIESKDPAT